MTTTTDRSKMTDDQKIASEMGWPVSAVPARLKALGLFVTCSRCGGSGRFSYNQMDGDRCFKCRGATVVAPKYSRKLIESAKAKVEAGELEPHFARLAVIREAKAKLPAVIAEAREAYSRISSEYDAAYNRGERLVGTSLFYAQHQANSIFWRDASNDGRSSSARFHGCLFPAVKELEGMAARGELAVDVAVELIKDRTARLSAITW